MPKYRSLFNASMKTTKKDTYGTIAITFDALPSRTIKTIYHEHYPAEIKLGNYIDNGFAAVNAILGNRNFITAQIMDPGDLNLRHAFPPLWISKKLYGITDRWERDRIAEFANIIQRKFSILWLIYNGSYHEGDNIADSHLDQLEIICKQCYCPELRKEILGTIGAIRFCKIHKLPIYEPAKELYILVKKFINTGRYKLLVSID